SFDHALLQTVINLGKSHGRWVSTISTIGRQNGGRLQGTHLDVFQVIALSNRTHIVRHITETSTPVVNELETILIKTLEKFFADYPINHELHTVVVGNQERQIK